MVTGSWWMETGSRSSDQGCMGPTVHRGSEALSCSEEWVEIQVDPEDLLPRDRRGPHH